MACSPPTCSTVWAALRSWRPPGAESVIIGNERDTMTDTPPPAILLTATQIQKLIPHRWPFLLVDRSMEEDRERGYIRGEKGVTASEWFFQGHFPELPVMPGVLQVEALAQTMAVYVAKQPGFGDRIGLFAAIDDTRFKRVVSPGDTLRLEVTMEKLGGRFGRGRGVASVDGETACEATLTF